MTKLSHSGKGKFEHCSEMYNLHYNHKIRPVGTTSALTFGSAIDAAAENYLLEGNAEHAINIFKHNWKQVQEQNHTPVEYHVNDFDHELLVQSDNELILKDTIYSSVSELVEAGQTPEKIVLAKWTSLYRKGLLIINGFIDWVDNNVSKVLEVQSIIELEDGEGNEITGKADFVLEMQQYDIPLLVDLKTAARYYERDSVRKSDQLALYFFYLRNTKYPEMKRASYLVLSKQIKKNRKKTCLKCGTVTHGTERSCAAETQDGLITRGKNKGEPKMVRCEGDFSVEIFPEVSIQFIHDEIPEEFIEDTIESYNRVITQINNKEFEKNPDGCNSYYGRECPYKKYCESGCMDGLTVKEDDKK